MYDLMCIRKVICHLNRIYKDLNFSVRARTWKKRDSGKQPLRKTWTSKSDCFHATLMRCMYSSKNRTKDFVHSVQNGALQLAQMAHTLFAYAQFIQTLNF